MVYVWSSLMKQGKRILKCKFMLICKGVSLQYKKTNMLTVVTYFVEVFIYFFNMTKLF